MAEVMEFMPNGNVTLILHRRVKASDRLSITPSQIEPTTGEKVQPLIDHNAPESAIGTEPQAPPPEEFDHTVYYAPDPPGAEDGPLYPPPRRAARGSDASSHRDRSASPPAAFWASLRKNAHVIDPIEDDEDDELRSVLDDPEEDKKDEEVVVAVQEVHCIVSSMHLMLASEYFRTMLGGNSKEALLLKTKGRITIRLKIDLDTMVILLNIIHGASRKVPRQVTLNSLTELAILAKGLGMLEAVEFFSDTWIDNLTREGFPKIYNDRVLPFLFVFWVFNRQVEFADMTRLAERESTDKLQDDVKDLPISREIIDAIKDSRQKAMQAAITSIHTLINRYLEGQTLCDGSLDDELRYACDAMILGSLLKTSRKIGIWPMPQAPFDGWKFRNLAKKIRGIRILDVCNKSSSRRWTSHGPGNNSHGLEDEIEDCMKALERDLEGLKLCDYARNSDDLIAKFHELLGPSVEEEVDQVIDDTSNALINFQEEHVEKPEEVVNDSPRYDLSVKPNRRSSYQEEEETMKHQEAEDAQAEFDALMRPRHNLHWEDEFSEPQAQNSLSEDESSVGSNRNSRSRWDDKVIKLEREASQEEYSATRPRYQTVTVEEASKSFESVTESVESQEIEFSNASKRKSQISLGEETHDHEQNHHHNKVSRHKYPAVPNRKSSIGKENDWFRAYHTEVVTQRDTTPHLKRESTFHNVQDTYDTKKIPEIINGASNTFIFSEENNQSHPADAFLEAEKREASRDFVKSKKVSQIPKEQRPIGRSEKRDSYDGHMASDHRLQVHDEQATVQLQDNNRTRQNGHSIPEGQFSPRIDSIKRKELVKEQIQDHGSSREYTRSPLRTEVQLQGRPSPPAIEKLKQEARIEPRRSRDFQQLQPSSLPAERLVIQESLNDFLASSKQSPQHQVSQYQVFNLEKNGQPQSPLFGEVKSGSKKSPRQSPTLNHTTHQENQQPNVQDNLIISGHSPRQLPVMKTGRSSESENLRLDETTVHPRPSSRQSSVLIQQPDLVPTNEPIKAMPRHSPTEVYRLSLNSPPPRGPPSPINSRVPTRLPTPPSSSQDQLPQAREHLTSHMEHHILNEKKVSIVPSFPHSLRNEIKSPVQDLFVAPKLGSIEEIMENVSSSVHSKYESNLRKAKGEVEANKAKNQTRHYPVKEDTGSHQIRDHIVQTAPETREILQDKNVTNYKNSETSNLPEDEEHDLLLAQMAPPKNFKMRKSKKIFTTRY